MIYFVLFFGPDRMVAMRFLSCASANRVAHTLNRMHKNGDRAFVVAYSGKSQTLTMFARNTQEIHGKA